LIASRAECCVIESVAARASRVLQMMDGRIVFDGDPAKLSAPKPT